MATRREPELRLREAGGDGDVVEEAEAHRAPGERVVAGWPDEREAAALDRLDCPPAARQRRAVRRLGRRGVAVTHVGPSIDCMNRRYASVWQRRISASVASRASCHCGKRLLKHA